MQIKSLGTSADYGWVYIRDAHGDCWACTPATLGPAVVMGLARGHWEILNRRFPLRDAAGDPLGYSTKAWRDTLLAEARALGIIRRLPQVKFVAGPIYSEFFELPPMRSHPAGGHGSGDHAAVRLDPSAGPGVRPEAACV